MEKSHFLGGRRRCPNLRGKGNTCEWVGTEDPKFPPPPILLFLAIRHWALPDLAQVVPLLQMRVRGYCFQILFEI